MRRGLAVGLVLLLAAGGYAGLDIEDRVPGILTLDPPPARPLPGVPGPLRPRPAERGARRRRPAGRGVAGHAAAGRRHAAPRCRPAPALAKVLAPALADRGSAVPSA